MVERCVRETVIAGTLYRLEARRDERDGTVMVVDARPMDRTGTAFERLAKLAVPAGHAPQLLAVLEQALRGLGIEPIPGARYPAASSPWRDEEDAALVRRFDAGETIEALADRLARPPEEVENRLELFGRLPASDPRTEGRYRRGGSSLQ
jgi:hypothetical protein